MAPAQSYPVQQDFVEVSRILISRKNFKYGGIIDGIYFLTE